MRVANAVSFGWCQHAAGSSNSRPSASGPHPALQHHASHIDSPLNTWGLAQRLFKRCCSSAGVVTPLLVWAFTVTHERGFAVPCDSRSCGNHQNRTTFGRNRRSRCSGIPSSRCGYHRKPNLVLSTVQRSKLHILITVSHRRGRASSAWSLARAPTTSRASFGS